MHCNIYTDLECHHVPRNYQKYFLCQNHIAAIIEQKYLAYFLGRDAIVMVHECQKLQNSHLWTKSSL